MNKSKTLKIFCLKGSIENNTSYENEPSNKRLFGFCSLSLHSSSSFHLVENNKKEKKTMKLKFVLPRVEDKNHSSTQEYQYPKCGSMCIVMYHNAEEEAERSADVVAT